MRDYDSPFRQFETINTSYNDSVNFRNDTVHSRVRYILLGITAPIPQICVINCHRLLRIRFSHCILTSFWKYLLFRGSTTICFMGISCEQLHYRSPRMRRTNTSASDVVLCLDESMSSDDDDATKEMTERPSDERIRC